MLISRNLRNLSETQSKASDEVFKTAEDNTSNSFSLVKQDSVETSISSGTRNSIVGGIRNIPTKNDGTVDYDGRSFFLLFSLSSMNPNASAVFFFHVRAALYEQPDSDDDLSMESHGSVVTHLLSQVKIGMDLTKVVLPTFILERRSLLEMYADYFAHPDLFLK